MKIPKACIICGKRAKRIPLKKGISSCGLHFPKLKEQKEKEEKIVGEVKI